MNMDEFDRLNTLSEKVLAETASYDDLKEFNELLNDWNTSAELNLFNDLLPK
jgi:hypothetical protein